MSKNAKCPCLKFACQWQDCLKKNNYKEEKCLTNLIKIQKCCEENYPNNKGNNKQRKEISPTCSGFVRYDD